MRRLVSAALAAATTRTAYSALGRVPAVAEGLARENYAGRAVTLLEGPALVLGLATAGAHGAAYGMAVAGGGVVGLLDDVAGSGSSKGLRGHLRALRRGEVTTGTLKILGLGATGLTTAVLLDGRDTRVVRTLLGGMLIAGCANLANLLDLRPGRALKAAALIGLPLAAAGSAPAAVVAGAGAAALPDDLAGRSMMGDTGANAIGAVLGAVLVERSGRLGRLLALTIVVSLTLASETVSFSQVIADTPVLRRLDAWGRG
ncbi:hypothetical protein [Leekyejoonella antrihumi]|uniref:UDP-N-acetylmuramyl pentapeptide phosphotransferase/UDP-N-acetylglucosamine-1-phosphate transferase n=1 Tax=Leekyejoonella antrihumi TaxID=1660198 RepID=A0A563DXE1_9MICO|nr:hypothetical protein [Leekyejoonella antrihumi]TWP34886.1 hypothetical protein FGL98_16165 [Leekyejoonella antrihumi]